MASKNLENVDLLVDTVQAWYMQHQFIQNVNQSIAADFFNVDKFHQSKRHRHLPHLAISPKKVSTPKDWEENWPCHRLSCWSPHERWKSPSANSDQAVNLERSIHSNSNIQNQLHVVILLHLQRWIWSLTFKANFFSGWFFLWHRWTTANLPVPIVVLSSTWPRLKLNEWWKRMEQTSCQSCHNKLDSNNGTMAPRKGSQNLPLRKARWADMKLKDGSPSPQRHLGGSQIFSWLIAAKGGESVRAQTGTARNCQKPRRDREFSVNHNDHNDINWQKLVGTKQLRSLFLRECSRIGLSETLLLTTNGSKWQLWSVHRFSAWHCMPCTFG